MEITDILQSNAYIKTGSAIEFKSPDFYITPFLERIEKSNLHPKYEVSVSGEVANKSDEHGKQVAYPRVAITAKFPNLHLPKEMHDTVVGMVYALDVQKPVLKVFAGTRAIACTNLCIFNADHIESVDMLAGLEKAYNAVNRFTNSIEEIVEIFKRRYDKMLNTTWDRPTLERMIGRFLMESINEKTIGTTTIVSATKDIIDPKSVYSMQNNEISEWLTYSAITQYITDKADILDQATKTLAVSHMFERAHRV
jgi:hypothetical protein